MAAELCEYCVERPGMTNSRYLRFDDDVDEGAWVCEICEEALRNEAEDLNGDPKAEEAQELGNGF